MLSGNRNFEGRVNADVRANYLASPPLVVAYALAGNMNVDVARAPIGTDQKGKKVYLRDIWPTSREIAAVIRKSINKGVFARKYADVFKGEANWRKIAVKGGMTFQWSDRSTYVQNPPYFEGMEKRPTPGRRHRRCAHPRPVPRLDHHRPHLAGGFDQGGEPGG